MNSITPPIKGEALKADWAKAVTEGVNEARPFSTGRRGLVSSGPFGTGFSVAEEAKRKTVEPPIPFATLWGVGGVGVEGEAKTYNLQIFLPEGALTVNGSNVTFDGQVAAAGGGWRYFPDLEIPEDALLFVAVNGTSATVTFDPATAGGFSFPIARIRKGTTAGGDDFAIVTQLVKGAVALGGSVAKIYEPTFTDGVITAVGAGVWGYGRRVYSEVDADGLIEAQVGTEAAVVYLKITHNVDAEPSAVLTANPGAMPTDSACAFPLYKVENGSIVLDYRGFPIAQVYE